MKLSEIIGRIYYLLKKDYFILFPYLIFTLLVFLASKFMESLKIGIIAWVLVFWVLDLLAQIATLKMTLLLDRETVFSLKACFGECFKKIFPFIFASFFAYFLAIGLSFGFSQIFYFKPALMPGAFFLAIMIFNLILVLWPAALIVENCGPLGAFKFNFLKIKSAPGQFFNLAILIMFVQLLGFLISSQFLLITGVGEVLSFLILGLTMAVLSMIKVLGYVNLGKK